jgi:hypothetical protein
VYLPTGERKREREKFTERSSASAVRCPVRAADAHGRTKCDRWMGSRRQRAMFAVVGGAGAPILRARKVGLARR